MKVFLLAFIIVASCFFLNSCSFTEEYVHEENYLESEDDASISQSSILPEALETDNLIIEVVEPVEIEKKVVETDFYVDPNIELAFVINSLSRQLIESINSNSRNSQSPLKSNIDQEIKNETITVTDFTNLDNFEQTNWLGQQISELLIHELHQRGFLVVDYRSTGRISVRSNGGFVLSRDWNSLPGELPVGKVLTGTLSKNKNGVIVNARIINFFTGMIEATSVGFIPSSLLVGGDASADIQSIRIERKKEKVIQIVN